MILADFVVLGLIALNIALGLFLSRRTEQMAQQMPTPEDRQMMLGRARTARTQALYVTPLILLGLYLLLLRPTLLGS